MNDHDVDDGEDFDGIEDYDQTIPDEWIEEDRLSKLPREWEDGGEWKDGSGFGLDAEDEYPDDYDD